MCCGHRAATPVVVEVGVVEVHSIRTIERDTVDTNPIAVALAVAGRMDNRMLVDIVAAHSVGMDDEEDYVHTPLLLLPLPNAVCRHYLDLHYSDCC